MGDKYSPEKLAELKSIGFNKNGLTKHNQAGVPIKSLYDTRQERVTVDENNSVYKDKADGTQDLTLNPRPIKVQMKSST